MSSFDRTVVKSSILLGSTIGLIGFSYGIAATSAGIPIALTCATSLLVFAGGSQFVALGVLAGGGSGVAAVASGLLLNARFVAFGVAVAPKLGGGAVRRAVAAHFLVDASAAMALGQSNRARAERAFWWSGLMIFAAWNLGTLLGAAGASVLGDPRVLGLDAAFPAAMLAMLEPHLRTPCGRRVAACGALIALVALFYVPPGAAIVAASLGVVAAWVAGRTAGGSAGDQVSS